jgi:hypothetical protein
MGTYWDIRAQMNSRRVLDQARQVVDKPGLVVLFVNVESKVPVAASFYFEAITIEACG